MSLPNHRIIGFDVFTATDDLFEKYFDLNDELFFEVEPDDTPYPRDLRKKMMTDQNPRSDTHRWLILSENDEIVIGFAQLNYNTKLANNYEQTKHIASVELGISKSFRRKGLGSKLLRTVLDHLLKLERITTLTSTLSDETGINFCNFLRGIFVHEESEFRLHFSKIDWDSIKQWKSTGEILSKSDGITLEMFETCPEDIIQDYTEIYTETLNQRPLGQIPATVRVTPETRKEKEKSWITDRGHKWFTMITKESDQQISGLTEMVYIPESPYYIEQLLTGVKTEYRGRGLGKWLKAEMIDFIHKKYPEIEFIATDNAGTNAPMISINERLGFKKHISIKTYQFNLIGLDDIIPR